MHNTLLPVYTSCALISLCFPKFGISSVLCIQEHPLMLLHCHDHQNDCNAALCSDGLHTPERPMLANPGFNLVAQVLIGTRHRHYRLSRSSGCQVNYYGHAEVLAIKFFPLWLCRCVCTTNVHVVESSNATLIWFRLLLSYCNIHLHVTSTNCTVYLTHTPAV